jgi:hypothetical protein
MTFVIDMRHYLDLRDLKTETPTPSRRRFGEYVGTLVMTATGWEPGQPIIAVQPCRRRPGHRPCPGPVEVNRTEVPAIIEWRCTGCDDHGIIHGWQGTPWDLTKPAADKPPLEVAVSAAEHQAMVTGNFLDTASERVVRSARRRGEMALMRASEADLDNLAGFVAFDANHTAARLRQRLLDSAHFRIEEALRKADQPHR